MPVQKEKKYEITFKNLRRREIPCLVIAVPQKNSETHSVSGGSNDQHKNRSKILKCLKQRLNRLSSTTKKKSKSLSCLDRKSNLTSKVIKPKVYRKKSLDCDNSPRKKNTEELLNSSADVIRNTPVSSTETSKKRAYRKKIRDGATITAITGSPVSTSAVETFFGSPVITPETPKKRVYRKKLKIPAVPHNTPNGMLCRTSDGDSVSSASFLSTTHSEVITVGKRGPGRPRLSVPAVIPGSDHGEESTMSLGSDKGSTTRRARRSLWASDSDSEGEADEISEYELLRQRNIEENLKKLREIFNQQGLQFEEKTSDTPKKRKSYSRLPLPPPRPRSQRIEIRRTFMPLDFSKLDEKLTMSEAAFM